jgi:hypothetical protein
VLLDSTSGGAAADAIRTSPQVRAVRSTRPSDGGLPAVILVRPDGYVAWAGDDRPDLADEAVAAVARWCGSWASADAGRPTTVSGADVDSAAEVQP